MSDDSARWLLGLTDDALRREVGAGAFGRGAAYARAGRVRQLSVGGGGRVLLASVQGSRARSYQSVISADLASDGTLLSWQGTCSCPVGLDCKHVVAVVLSARGRATAALPARGRATAALPARGRMVARSTKPASFGALAPPAPTPSWEHALSALLGSSPTTGDVPLALCVEPDAAVGRVGVPAIRAPRWMLRPVTIGRSGRWVRTGVGWSQLARGQAPPRARRDHVELARQLHATALARGGQTRFWAGEAQLGLDDVGPGLWRLLREAADLGLRLVDGAGLPAELAQAPALLSLDVTREEAAADLALAPTVTLDGAPVDARQVSWLGRPAHGVVLSGHDGPLRLARLGEPADDALRRLFDQARPMRVPAAEASRFLALYVPALRCQLEIRCPDGSVEFGPPAPPRLRLRATYGQDHRLDLRWMFRYDVGADHVDVALPDGHALPPGESVEAAPEGGGPQWAPDLVRDTDGEQQALAAVTELGQVRHLMDRLALPTLGAGAGDGPAGSDVGRGLALRPSAQLSGLDTAVFSVQALPALQSLPDVDVEVRGEPAAYRQADETPLITLSATHPADDELAGQGQAQDWFDLGVRVSVGGEEVPFEELFSALADAQEELLLPSGTWFRVDRPEFRTLKRLIEEARELSDHEGESLRLTRYQAGLWQELVALGVVERQSARWSEAVDGLLDVTGLGSPPLPQGLRATLRPYQRDGFDWLSFLWDHRLGGILADDMGLGKTLQTLAVIARAKETGALRAPALIVAPTSVMGAWAGEAQKFCPDLRVVTVTETRRRRGSPLAEVVVDADVVVTSYALFRIDEAEFQKSPWSVLVLDEAQFVKNHQAKTYQCARRLDTPVKLAITGTPLENSLMDLWALLSIVAPGLFANPQRFTQRYRTPIESGADGAGDLLSSLRRRIRPLMLRRTKEEVAADLPAKQEQLLRVALNEPHQRVYQRHLQRERQRVLGMIDDLDRNRIAVFRSLTLLRQLALDPSLVDEQYAGTVRSSKIDVLAAHLGDVVAEGHRVLVFSQFTRFLRLVRERLAAEGIACAYLDGRTRDRAARIAQFTDGDVPVFLISLKAGGVGLTLTQADYVYVLDPWWNPAAEAQAVDRAHRIGQDKNVMVYRLVATDTIEDKVVALQERKRALFDKVVDDGALLSGALSADDIRGLLTG